MNTVRVSYSGPFFDGRNPQIVAKMRRDIIDAVSSEAERRVRAFGEASFRYESSPPTGDWMKSIHTEHGGDYAVVTTDIVYGPWLEGVGSRNRTTRFKGYAMFRRTLQTLERGDAGRIAEPIIDRAVRELNT